MYVLVVRRELEEKESMKEEVDFSNSTRNSVRFFALLAFYVHEYGMVPVGWQRENAQMFQLASVRSQKQYLKVKFVISIPL